MHFYQYNNSWIFIPKEVEVFGSKDGEKWIPWGKELKKSDPKQRGKFIESFELANTAGEARFIKVKAKNMKEVPAWHEAAGSEPWLFIDEIIIR